MIDFANPSDGWLLIYGSPGMSHIPSIILHTTDGGQHWNELANSENTGVTGIFFTDVQNGWESASDDQLVSMNPAQPWLGVTHDGGQTWHDVQLPMLPGAGKNEIAHPTPPVLFGKNGLLPVQDQHYGGEGIGLDLYVTHDGGQTWTPTKFLAAKGDQRTLNSFTVDIVDMYHVWVTIGTNLYATSDGGQSWIKLPQLPQAISHLRFTDLLRFLDTHNGWALGSINTTSGEIKKQPPNLLHTTDGGCTWQSINYSIVGKPTATPSTPMGQ